MGDHRSPFLSREIGAGFLSPIDSLRFFNENKFLLLLSLFPHLCGIALYIWAVKWYALPFLITEYLTPLLNSVAWWASAGMTAISVTIYVVAAVAYTILGFPIVSTIASPIYDIAAEKAFRKTSGKRVPNLGFKGMFSSFVSELIKLILIGAVFTFSFFVPPAAPIAFLASIWFFGWDHMDRTLSILGLPLRKRIAFGIRHSITCVSLGIWTYVPFAGSILSFVMATAGAIAVAKVGGELKLLDAEPSTIPSRGV